MRTESYFKGNDNTESTNNKCVFNLQLRLTKHNVIIIVILIFRQI